MKVLAGIGAAAFPCAALAAAASAQTPASTPVWQAVTPGTVYTKDKPPATPKLEDLPLQDSVSQYGITWTFDKKVRVGRFVTGDYYVVGPVTVASVTPAPTGEDANFRNGSVLNPPVTETSAYEGRCKNSFKKDLVVRYPVALKAGDSLVSAVSVKEHQQNRVLPNPTRKDEFSFVESAAVLTCLPSPVAADAFRPGYCDQKKARIHRAAEIHWDLLPGVALAKGAPELAKVERAFERPWIDHVWSWSSREIHPLDNMPGYGRKIGRMVSLAGLLLVSDMTREQKARPCRGMIQVGIDNWAIAQRGKRGEGGGWPAQGGFGNGRKFPIVFAAILLQDDEMLHLRRFAPETCFGEDEHTEFGDCWTGAKVRFTGQFPQIGGKPPYEDRGPYEHLTPDKWPGKDKTMSEGYRRCCTSICWVGQALAMRLMKAEKVWDHDAFFVYVDRWMYEDDTKFVEEIKKVYPKFGDIPQRTTEMDPFVDEMWAKYRRTLPAPIDDWMKPHEGPAAGPESRPG